MTEQAQPNTLIDNEKVNVALWQMAPETNIGDHTHASDYLVIPLSAGDLTIAAGGDDIIFPLVVGTTFYGNQGDSHDVLNKGTEEVRFLEIHLK